MDEKITKHFNKIAGDYDLFKKKNSYYYENLKKMYSVLIPDSRDSEIIEIGCGTGDIIANLNPKFGMGIDISENMIALARKKHSKTEFKIAAAENVKLKEKFDYIILPDVIEHLQSVEKTISNLKRIMKPTSKMIISMANPVWEPVLQLLELFRLKMPEGPHNRISITDLKKILLSEKLKITGMQFCLLIPADIPVISKINNWFYKIPLLKKLGLMVFISAVNQNQLAK